MTTPTPAVAEPTPARDRSPMCGAHRPPQKGDRLPPLLIIQCTRTAGHDGYHHEAATNLNWFDEPVGWHEVAATGRRLYDEDDMAVAVDAARAPLLAEVERLTRELAEARTTIRAFVSQSGEIGG